MLLHNAFAIVCGTIYRRGSLERKEDDIIKQLQGTYPQIYTVCHVWTFDFQLFSDVRYATFQHKSQ